MGLLISPLKESRRFIKLLLQGNNNLSIGLFVLLKSMSYISNISNISYNHQNTSYNGRFNNVLIDGDLTATNYHLHSSRINVPLDPIQELHTYDPNPSYIIFTADPQEGLYNYDESNANWTLTDPTTITINKTGIYLVSMSIFIASDTDIGQAIIQLFNSTDGPIGTVPPITGAINLINGLPFSSPLGSYGGSCTASATALIQAGSKIRAAYIVTTTAVVSPTSCISLVKLS